MFMLNKTNIGYACWTIMSQTTALWVHTEQSSRQSHILYHSSLCSRVLQGLRVHTSKYDKHVSCFLWFLMLYISPIFHSCFPLSIFFSMANYLPTIRDQQNGCLAEDGLILKARNNELLLLNASGTQQNKIILLLSYSLSQEFIFSYQI